MRRVVKLVSLAAAGEMAALVVWFLWMDWRISRECDRIERAFPTLRDPELSFDAFLMQYHGATRGGRA